MEKSLLVALLTGAAASGLTALITGIFATSKNRIDMRLAEKKLLYEQQEAERLEERAMRGEIRTERDRLQAALTDAMKELTAAQNRTLSLSFDLNECRLRIKELEGNVIRVATKEVSGDADG